ncbi:N-6 DNA methylase [Kutzneria buriramensis]|uniref:N-6 DNA methylase n=1 Tax=Kutzneria buriramensis TaxID=1045776 RepID=A0A3E0G5G9_9PSEU|nr:N-6 DNA methylase [Kutzneria buriramensis]REH17450.1 N-6 DNA methylase [Kutzneria buriramensis]
MFTACGTGALLLAAARRGIQRIEGQDADRAQVRVAALRLAFGHDVRRVELHGGDALYDSAFEPDAASSVVCVPPSSDRSWNRQELLHDIRWTYGVPTQADAGLAWIQHVLSGARPGGSAVLLLPPTVAGRPSGSTIRASLVRGGVVRAVVALPPGSAAQHGVPLQAWVLERPRSAEPVPRPVLFVDVSSHSTGSALDVAMRSWTAFRDGTDTFAGLTGVARSVRADEILAVDADLTPRRHVASVGSLTSVAQFIEDRARFAAMAADLARSCPDIDNEVLDAGRGAVDVSLGELAQAGQIILLRPGRGRRAEADDDLPLVHPRDIALGWARATFSGPQPSPAGSAVRVDDVVVSPLLDSKGQIPARVADASVAGAGLAPDTFLIRADSAVVDPWYLVGFLSSTIGGLRAAQVAALAGGRSRFAPDRLRVLLPAIDVLREFGRVFRETTDFVDRVRDFAGLGRSLAHRFTMDSVRRLSSSVDEDRHVATQELSDSSPI